MSDGEYLILKWGTLKAWKFESEKTRALLQQYADLGMSLGAMQQRDTPLATDQVQPPQEQP